jgi:hypothetical protein
VSQQSSARLLLSPKGSSYAGPRLDMNLLSPQALSQCVLPCGADDGGLGGRCDTACRGCCCCWPLATGEVLVLCCYNSNLY